VNAVDSVTGPVFNLGEVLGDTESAMGEGIDAAIAYIDATNAGATSTEAMAAGVELLAIRGVVTEASLAAMTSAVGKQQKETIRAIETTLKNADALGLSAAAVDALRSEQEKLLAITPGYTTATQDATTASFKLIPEIMKTGGVADTAAPQLAGFVSELAEGATEAEIMAEQLGFLNDQLDDYIGRLATASELAKRGITPARIGEVLSGGVIVTGVGSGAAQKQHGGPVTAGAPFIVGEAGPELFIPDSAGRIVANNKLGGGVTVNVNQPVTLDLASDISAGLIAGQVTQLVEGLRV
jgi:hypothetical protein